MRYVSGKRSLLAWALLSLAGCMGQPPIDQPSLLLINEDGCRQDAVDKARLFFHSAVVYITAARPENAPRIPFGSPIAFDLLNPRSVAAVFEALPPGVYYKLFFEVSSAAIVLNANPERVLGLSVPNGRIEAFVPSGFTIPRAEANIEVTAACVDGLKVNNGAAFLSPGQISVNRIVAE